MKVVLLMLTRTEAVVLAAMATVQSVNRQWRTSVTPSNTLMPLASSSRLFHSRKRQFSIVITGPRVSMPSSSPMPKTQSVIFTVWPPCWAWT